MIIIFHDCVKSECEWMWGGGEGQTCQRESPTADCFKEQWWAFSFFQLFCLMFPISVFIRPKWMADAWYEHLTDSGSGNHMEPIGYFGNWVPNPAQRIYFRQVIFFTAGSWTATTQWSRDRIFRIRDRICVEIEVVVTLRCILAILAIGVRKNCLTRLAKGVSRENNTFTRIWIGDLHGKS